MMAPTVTRATFGFLMLVSVSVFGLACLEEKESEQVVSSPAESTPQAEDQYLEIIKALYEKAKQSGEQVPDDIVQWVTEDYKQIGTWQYAVLEFSAEEDADIEKKLNQLGSKRWECFWVEKAQAGTRFYLKKPGRSYLHRAAKVIRLFPTGDGEQ